MSSGFLYLKDGRGFSQKAEGMARILAEIHSELLANKEAADLADYLSKFILTEDHELNGYGGFYHKQSREVVMLRIDFREWTEDNQRMFWEAARSRLAKLISGSDVGNAWIITGLRELIDMNDRADKGEPPMELNHMRGITPPTGKKSGPGW